ncbi:MAG: methionine adenosyltransferase [Mycoplasma sp.]|nr:methionine adenosyltransferase [Mycoplasma sp.]
MGKEKKDGVIYKNFFTSESVGVGHPDKLCDQIADAILDEALRYDKNSKTSIEVMITNKYVIIGGEINTKSILDYEEIAKQVLKNAGLDVDWFSYQIIVQKQSIEIASKVDIDEKIKGAGDQGIKFGYACLETPNYMPLPIELSHEILKKVESLRHSYDFIKSDMKSQVTIDYTNQKPKINNIVLSVQHSKDYDLEEIKNFLLNNAIMPIVNQYNLNNDFRVYINNGGSFSIGGSKSDTGLTGRKIIVDTYGGMARHGGGSFSGKDYTKLDRSGAYLARWIAKNLVAAGITEKIEIQLAYVIGNPNPTALAIETYGTSKYSDQNIINLIYKLFDLTPNGIRNYFNLDQPIFLQTAVFGHFGNKNLPWENLNVVDKIKDYINNLQD